MKSIPPVAELTIVCGLFFTILAGDMACDVAGSMVCQRRSLGEAVGMALTNSSIRYSDEELNSPIPLESSLSMLNR